MESLKPSDFSAIFSKFSAKMVADVSDFTLVISADNRSRKQNFTAQNSFVTAHISISYNTISISYSTNTLINFVPIPRPPILCVCFVFQVMLLMISAERNLILC